MKTLEDYKKEFNYLTEEFNRTYKCAEDVKKLVSLYDTVISTYNSQDSDMKDVFDRIIDSVNIDKMQSAVSAVTVVLKKRVDSILSIYDAVAEKAYSFDITSQEFGDWSDLALEIYDKAALLKKKIDKI